MNLASILLLAVIVLLFLAAIRHMVKNGGVCSCGTVGHCCNGKSPSQRSADRSGKSPSQGSADRSGKCSSCDCKTCGKQKE